MKMKSLLICLLLVLFIIPTAMAKQVTLQFEWTPNTEPDIARYVLYHRVEGQGYSYEIPAKIIPCLMIGEGAYDPNDAKFTFEAADGSMSVNHFVIRAEDTEQFQSGDSNEVDFTVDLRVIPAATMLVGVYNDVNKTIDFTWSQQDADRIARWDLFNSNTSGGPYTKVGEVLNTGLAPPYTTTWDVPRDGVYYFTVVGFTSEVFAVDSNEAGVEVRVHPSPVHNFKVKIRIY